MTRTQHKAHPTPGFPVYCLDWASENELVLGGGGGESKSGIDNKLKLAKISKDGREVQYIHELKLSNEEDAPMTLAVDRESGSLVTGINASSSSIKNGNNSQCRLFSIDDNELSLKNKVSTIAAEWSDDYPYQKLTSISPDSTHVAVGSTDNRVSILKFPSLEEAFPPIQLDQELVDLDWGGKAGNWIAITTVAAIYLYRIVGEKPKLESRQVIKPPAGDTKIEFRAGRFSRAFQPFRIHAALNSAKPKTGSTRKAWIATYRSNATLPEGKSDMEVELLKAMRKEKERSGTVPEGQGAWQIVDRREVGNKPITVFDASADGKLLAYGCSDLSIGILDAKTLAPLLKILKAHSFPPTALKFNPATNLLVSASADNTIRAIVVPAKFNSGVPIPVVVLIWAFLLLLLALYGKKKG